MTLRLSIENVSSLTSGDPVEVALEQHGLIIGRAAHADWTLPDPKNFISSVHCEIDYQGGRYFLTDRSTNGTFINGSTQRFTKPYQLRDGDLVAIGQYQVRVEEVPEEGGVVEASPFATAEAAAFGTGLDWGAGAGPASKPIDERKFGREPPKPLFQSASDPLMNAFAMPGAGGDPFGTGGGGASPSGFGGGDPFGIGGGASAPASAPPADPFGLAAPSPAPPPAARPAPAPAPAGDPFGIGAPPPQRGTIPPPSGDPFGFAGGAPAAPAGADPFGIGAAPAPSSYAASPAPAPATADPWAKLHGQPQVDFAAAMAPAPPPVAAAPAPAPRAAAAPAARPAAAPAPGEAGLFDKLLAATGIRRADLGDATPEAVVEAAGQLLRQTADGLIRLLDARTRIRNQFGVGASVTTFQRAGNNPLKWTRKPDEALRRMMGAPDPGDLPGAQAVRGAFEDLQAHEMAMIAAMQDAMQATIERFAPDKIKERISARGWLKSVLPGSREATLWRAYETEFRAFADETEAAYLDLFAKHFKKAYERTIAKAGPG